MQVPSNDYHHINIVVIYLHERHGLLGYARKRLRDREDADDATQQTGVDAKACGKTFKTEAEAKQYPWGIHRHNIVNIIRGRLRGQRFGGKDVQRASPASAADEAIRREAMRERVASKRVRRALGRALRKLPRMERQAFVRLDIWKWSQEAAAERMFPAVFAVNPSKAVRRVRVYRSEARRKLRVLLDRRDFSGS